MKLRQIIEDINTENQDVTINDDSDESGDDSVDNRRDEHLRCELRRQRVNPNYLVDLFWNESDNIYFVFGLWFNTCYYVLDYILLFC